MRYHQLWAVLAVSLGAVGLVGAMLATSTGVIVGVTVVSGGISWLAWRALGRRNSRSVSQGAAAAAAAVGALAALAVVGLGAFVGTSAVLIALCFAATAPPTLRWLAARFRQMCERAQGDAGQQPPTEPAATQTEPTEVITVRVQAHRSRPATPAQFLPPEASLHTLSDAELCWAWRTSYTALQRHHTTTDLGGRAHLVHLRQQYLDELERRNPAGFRRWLYTGARPASDPSRYITTTRK